MNRLGAETLIRNLPAATARPALIKQLVTANVAAYAYYSYASGAGKIRYRNFWTLQPESGPQCLFTFHFCHTNLAPLLFNVGLLATLGSHHVARHGVNHFAKIFGISAAGAALFAGYDMRTNAKQTQAGGLGVSAGFLTYYIMRDPSALKYLRFTPLSILAAMTFYGVYYDDKAVLGGLAAGYGAFLAAL